MRYEDYCEMYRELEQKGKEEVILGSAVQIITIYFIGGFLQIGRRYPSDRGNGAEYLHFDVMDGVSVPSISFGMPVLASIKPLVKQVMDTHLMEITEPIRYVEAFAKAGADILTIHYEACEDVRATLEKIRRMRHEDRTFHFTGYTGRGPERISW